MCAHYGSPYLKRSRNQKAVDLTKAKGGMSSLRASMSGKMSSAGKFSRGRNKSNTDDLAARQAAGNRVLAERHAKELKQEEGLLSEELVEFSQQVMRASKL